MFPIKTSYISLGDIGGTSYSSNTPKKKVPNVEELNPQWMMRSGPHKGTLEDTNFGPKTAWIPAEELFEHGWYGVIYSQISRFTWVYYICLSLSPSLSLSIAFSRSSAGSTMVVPSQNVIDFHHSRIETCKCLRLQGTKLLLHISMQCVVRLAAPPFLHGTAGAVCRPLQEQKLILHSLAPSWTSNPPICGRPGGQFEKTLPLPNQQ